MTLSLPTLVAFLGTALMAVAIFAPRRSVAMLGPALPVAAAPVPRFTTAATEEPLPEQPLRWLQHLEFEDTELDAGARADIVRALAALAEPWAEAILQQARLEESDPIVVAALSAALSAGLLPVRPSAV